MSMREVKAALQKMQSKLADNWKTADAVQCKPDATPVELELAVLQKACVNEAMLALVPVQAAVSLHFLQREQERWRISLRRACQP